MIIAGYNITKYFVSGGMFSRRSAVVKAVQNVDIKIKEGETVGLVGESGSGKTTLAKLLIGLEDVTEGSILFNIPDEEVERYEEALERKDKDTIRRIEREYDITKISKARLRKLRRYMSIVFQDPYSSLDPRMRVIDIIKEPMISTGYLFGEEANKRVFELLEKVGLPKWFAYRYPHELSGGQRQRVAIARALATNPKFIALDEPTSALDVSTQAQILNLLKSLQKEENISYLLITHNIAVASYLSNRIY
ncbi:MAG: dipeptide/oligopeptide/nickel ABC transporter ATP-binding protein, partial [Sulfolobales archaeon]